MTRISETSSQSDVEGLFEIGRRPSTGRYLREIWSKRAFAARMPLEELRTEHLNTALGNLWHLLNPVLLTATYFLVFGVVARIDRGEENFLTFLTIGIFTFQYTQRSITAGAKSIPKNRGLIVSIWFPRAILPMAAVISQTIVLLPSVAVLLAVALLTGEPVSGRWLLIVPALAGLAFLNLGASLLVARLTARYRDAESFLGFFMRLLFYTSGVLYPVQRWVADAGPWQHLFNWNPMYAFITIIRGCILDSVVNVEVVISATAWTSALLVIGFRYFLRGEQEYGRA